MSVSIKNLITNLIFPPRCVFCGERLSPKVNFNVCTDCSNNLPYCKTYRRCTICGTPVATSSGEICRRCVALKRYFVKSASAFVYTDKVRSSVIAYKKSGNSSYARVFSYYIAGMVKSDFPAVDFDAVVSVPPRKKSFTDEDFDQAGFLARQVALRLELPCISKALVQTKRISKQSTLNYNARLTNVQDAFSVKKKDSVSGKTLLLIDDVRTSGSTLNECSKALKEAGAYRIYTVTVATAVL